MKIENIGMTRNNMLRLEDYYLVKCFQCSEYREQFNHGTNIHINSLKYFWNVGNAFQQDNEGLIFRQHNNGYIIQTHGLEKEITNYHSVGELLNKHPNRLICKTSDFYVGINGFICCFYLLSKKDVQIGNNLKITNPQEEKDFYYFLKMYYNENNAFYASVYNSANFCTIFSNEMLEKGYNVCAGGVKYYDLTEEEKRQLYMKNDIISLTFIKPTKLRYQKEFRILLSKQGKSDKDFISENGIDLMPSKIFDFDHSYLN